MTGYFMTGVPAGLYIYITNETGKEIKNLFYKFEKQGESKIKRILPQTTESTMIINCNNYEDMDLEFYFKDNKNKFLFKKAVPKYDINNLWPKLELKIIEENGNIEIVRI